MSKKLLSVVMSGAILAGMCPNAKAQELSKFQKIKNSVCNTVKNNKKFIAGSTAVAVGVIGFYLFDKLTSENNSGYPRRSGDSFKDIQEISGGRKRKHELKLVDMLKSNKDILNLKLNVSESKKFRDELCEIISDPKNKALFYRTYKILPEFEGIQDLPDDAPGILVMTKMKSGDNIINIKLEFVKDKDDEIIEIPDIETVKKNLSEVEESFKNSLIESIKMNISDESEEKKKESVDLLNSEVDKFKDALVNLKYLSQKEDASKKNHEHYNENANSRIVVIKYRTKNIVDRISIALKNTQQGIQDPGNAILTEMNSMADFALSYQEINKDDPIDTYSKIIVKMTKRNLLEAMNY